MAFNLVDIQCQAIGVPSPHPQIHFITDVRRDFRITVGLSFFKEHFPCNEEGQMPAPPAGKFFLSLFPFPRNTLCPNSTELDESLVESLCRSMFVRCESELDLDRESGQQLLRILLQMTMSDFAPLTSIALKLLFRHFSQFQELMEDMKQVGAEKRAKFTGIHATCSGPTAGLEPGCGKLPAGGQRPVHAEAVDREE